MTLVVYRAAVADSMKGSMVTALNLMRYPICSWQSAHAGLSHEFDASQFAVATREGQNLFVKTFVFHPRQRMLVRQPQSFSMAAKPVLTLRAGALRNL